MPDPWIHDGNWPSLPNDVTRCLGVDENLGKRNATRSQCARRFECRRHLQLDRDADRAAIVSVSDMLCGPGVDLFISARYIAEDDPVEPNYLEAKSA